MTIVIPATDHPLRIASVIPRVRSTGIIPKKHSDAKAQLAADVDAFLKAGNQIEVLPGFPERVVSSAVNCSDSMGF